MNYDVLKKFFRDKLNFNIDEFKDNIKIINYSNLEEIIQFIGAFKIKKNDIIVDCKLMVPEIKDLKSMLINIHEFTHFFMIINQIDKKDYYDIYEEVFPITMERIFVHNFAENQIKNFNLEQLEKLNFYINCSNYNKYKYIIGYYYQFILNEKYEGSISELFNYQFNEKLKIDNIKNETIKLLKK